ncbi:molecular chaperone GrpE [Nocardiopsis mwathae]|uniref:Protein GrpE n=1 Tax=Nocardiopsis mwathae TaxID=1472723 RepID=A0A7X0D722_9ACTN|nr:nucleotide exchange factor GrpE [Nocardiopsis mwathae]MBB6173988.1 molecular chaperone GrpE [Nocardiopsis mwathae]
MALPENENGHEQQGPVIRDKRRIDPETGELRVPEEAAEAAADTAAAAGASPADAAELAEAKQQVAELTNDLKRLQAEYANYRKRVDRDRAAVREQGLAQVLVELLPILDDIGRARDHDELNGGFKSVGEALESAVTKLGLKKYGEKDDEFDPTVHEALTMVPMPGVTTPKVIEVFQPGYIIGERVIRPARVIVAGQAEGEDAEPQEGADGAAPAAGSAAASAPEDAADASAAESGSDGEDKK